MNATIFSPPAAEAPAKLLTAEEFVGIYENQRVEPVRGQVVEIPMPFLEHGFVCMQLGFFLNSHVRGKRSWPSDDQRFWIKTREGPDSVRGADVLFYSYERLPKETAVPDGYAPIAPGIGVRSAARRPIAGATSLPRSANTCKPAYWRWSCSIRPPRPLPSIDPTNCSKSSTTATN